MAPLVKLFRDRLAGTGWSQAHVQQALDLVDDMVDAINANTAGGGKIAANGTQTAPVNNTIAEVAHYTLTIPANTLVAGDLLRVYFYYDVAASGDTFTSRVRANGTLIASSGAFGGIASFEFLNVTVIDTGVGPSAFRFVSDFEGADEVFDTTLDMVWTFTAQWNVASVPNTSTGLSAHISR